jgi:tetratricopeptide (TPR) repeat protein
MVDNNRPAFNATDLAKKEQYYLALVEKTPNSAEGWIQLGLIAMEQKKHAVAIQRLEKALALNPSQEDCDQKLGMCHLELGQFARALTHFLRFTQRRPEDPDGHSNLGSALAQLGRRDEAVASFEKALRIRPDMAPAHCNLANVLGEQGNTQGAIAHYQKAITLNPGYAEAHHHLGMTLVRQGQAEHGLVSLRQAVALNRGYVQALLNLAATCVAVGRLDEAVAVYRRLLKVRPDFSDAAGFLASVLTTQNKDEEAVAVLNQSLLYQPNAPDVYHMLAMISKKLGRPEDAAAAFGHTIRLQPSHAIAHNNLGNVLLTLEKRDEAIERYRQAIALMPDYVEAHSNLAAALSVQERWAESLAPLAEALRLNPKHAQAHHNLGTSCRRLGRFEEAIACGNRAVELDPKYADAHCGLGAALPYLGLVAEALACFDRALEINPKSPDYHTNRAIMLLLLGDFARGLDAYEWRLNQRSVKPRLAPQPVWDGTPMPGGTILLYAEQGMGDTIMAVRYARMVKALFGTVLLECPGPLVSLMATCPGIDGIVDPTAPAPAADVQLPLMSLPRIFGTRLDTIPADGPFIFSDAMLRERWRKVVMGGRTDFQSVPQPIRVGIVWQGNPKHPGDAYRSVKLAQFAPLAAVPGVKLYSLQKGAGAEQVAALDGQFEVVDLGAQFGPEFRDAAAAIESLDLVIAVDTSVAHLAGALGRPVWVMLPFYPDWRWQLAGDTSAWYPTARLFRQQKSGAWDDVFGRVATALGEMVAAPPERTVAMHLTPGEIEALIAMSQGDLQERLRSALPSAAAA